MKKIIATIAILSISTFGFGQNQNKAIITELKTIEYSDSREVFHVCKSHINVTYKEDLDYFWYNKFSNVKSTKGGAGGNLLHGKYQFFDENGNLKQEANFYLGLKDGFQKIWGKDGKIDETYKYNKGIEIYSKFKSDKSDNIIEWNGPASEIGSVKKVYNSFGQLEQSELVLDYFLYKITQFYYSGKVKRKYIIGTPMNGEDIEYYENGKIKQYAKYESDWRVGEWKWYNEDGSIDAVDKYRINRQYYSTKKIKSEGGEYFDTNINEWIKNGLWIWYKENGKDWEKSKEYKLGLEVEEKD